jgi:hypothetical protein
MGDVGRIGDCEFLRLEKKVTIDPDWSTGNPETGKVCHQ